MPPCTDHTPEGDQGQEDSDCLSELLRIKQELSLVPPKPIHSAEEFRVLMNQELNTEEEKAHEASLKMRAHYKAVVSNPDYALGPDLNNFWTMLVPEYSYFLDQSGEPANDKAKKILSDVSQVQNDLEITPENLKKVITSGRNSLTSQDKEGIAAGDATIVRMYKGMRELGYSHEELLK